MQFGRLPGDSREPVEEAFPSKPDNIYTSGEEYYFFTKKRSYGVFHGFGHAKFTDGGLALGSNQFLILH